MGSYHPYFVVSSKLICFCLLINYGFDIILLLPVSYAIDVKPKSNLTSKCLNRITNFVDLPCDYRIRLFLAYNKLRDEVAGGRFENHPVVGNMLRSKWLISAEKYARKRVENCDPTVQFESNVSLNNTDNAKFEYSCEFVYVNKLFKEWTFYESIDFLLDASFENNYFQDFDEEERFKRVSVEGFGCSIALDFLGIDMIQGFIGCGFCNSITNEEKAYKAKPCSKCNQTLRKDEFIPSACDDFFRNLCTALNSNVTLADTNTYTDRPPFNQETLCNAEHYMVHSLFTNEHILSKTIPVYSSLFLKITYVLPLITIGLLLYYMGIIKGQSIYSLQIPSQFPSIQELNE